MMDEKPFESMNVIPFVDIMLVMLTIVLTTASFITTGRLPMTLPHASQAIPGNDRPHIIELTATGRTALDGKDIARDALTSELTGLPQDTAFLIRADRALPLQQFVDVLDILKRGHFTKVSMQTQGAP
ncbi:MULTISPECIES: ExbD/TolR family protein [Acetobacter]|jgi:biopolymer transport protein ExbD|uniref:Biopolymer transport protein ExbD n=1 Tax=Acetobacter lovaniensis TaxID=104100 RepID=A0A841QK10_9PROT|nr:biopolymer transporter ExbD [Acetobacter lovaniensis]MBB6458564.1 biopolymer transport protein ExbD [Acetobacter lovaniensis]MCI1698942.1 biopolymer transporter ExbD [Acetobacter lovaniensis]MCP1240750.1 biopolymer transporter ExbD [Acetobacter lovaniensis]GBQ65078.1 biopolymer transport protein [Acetobacter lovaniensis NRIC 0474]